MFFVINCTEFWKKIHHMTRLLVGHSHRHNFKPMNQIPGLRVHMLRYHHWISATSWSVSAGCTFVPPKKWGGSVQYLVSLKNPNLLQGFFLEGSWWRLNFGWRDLLINEWWQLHFIYESTVKMIEVRCSVLEYHDSDSDPPPKITNNWCK